MNEATTKTILNSAQRNAPLVTVIMPCYNTSAFIGEAIESVLQQDYPAVELIVIDDGSTDDTVDVVRSFGERIVLLQQANQGAAVARSKGLEQARGEFITFLDSDDCWLPGKIRAQVEYLQAHPSIDAVFSQWSVWKPDAGGTFPSLSEIQASFETESALPGIVPEKSGWLYNRLLFGSIMHTITVMMRRSLTDKLGPFDPELKRGQDYEYWFRASRETEIHQLRAVHALYRIHGNGCAIKWPNENYEYLVVKRAIDRWGLEGPNGEKTKPSSIKKRLAETCFSFGYYHYHQGNKQLSREAMANTLRYQPSHIGAWKYFFFASLPIF